MHLPINNMEGKTRTLLPLLVEPLSNIITSLSLLLLSDRQRITNPTVLRPILIPRRPQVAIRELPTSTRNISLAMGRLRLVASSSITLLLLLVVPLLPPVDITHNTVELLPVNLRTVANSSTEAALLLFPMAVIPSRVTARTRITELFG